MKKPILPVLIGMLLPVLFIGVLFFAMTTPFSYAQNNNVYPTPTYVALPDDFTYEIKTISVSGDPIVFDDTTVDGFAFTDFTYTTRYPRGLEFSARISVPDDIDEIASVNLVYTFPAGTSARESATYDPENDLWTAHPYDTGGLPAWMSMDVSWRVAYGETGLVETEPVNVQYIDPTREWFRMESEDAIVYWFDFSEELGDVVAEAFVSVRARYLEAFGDFLPFKPTVIIFPPGDAIGEARVNGQFNPRTTGYAVSDNYAAVLRIRGLEIEDLRTDCIWNEERDEEWQMRFSASVATHEVAHLYQYAFGNGIGPTWWIEGQATYLELEMGPVEERLRALVASGEELMTFQGAGPSGMVSRAASDGCTHLGYEMGAHMINYIVNRFGPDAHAAIVDNIVRNVPFDQAIEIATGLSLAQLEREWRIYLGADPEPFVLPTAAPPVFPTATPFGQ